MPLITAECESLYDSLRFDCYIHLRQLLLIELIKRQPDRADGVEQIAATPRSILDDGCYVLCIDELPLLQFSRILADDAQAHTRHSADGPAAGSVPIGISVFTTAQIGVYCQCDGKRPIRNMCGRRT